MAFSVYPRPARRAFARRPPAASHAHVLAVAAACTLLLAAPPVRGDTPSRDLDDYVLLATEDLRMKEFSFTAGGNVGVNAAGGHLRWGRPSFFPDGTQVVADVVGRIGAGSSLWDLFGNTIDARNLAQSVVRNAGPLPVIPLPLIDPLPEVPDCVPPPDAPSLTVTSGESATIAAGVFGPVRVNNGATLTVAGGGTVCVDSLRVGRSAALLFESPTEMDVAGKLRVGPGSTVGPVPGSGLDAPDVRLNVAGTEVVLSASTRVTATVLAPDALLRFGRLGVFSGQFIGRRLRSDFGTEFARRSCGDVTAESGQVSLRAPAEGDTLGPLTLIVAAVSPFELRDSLVSHCVGGLAAGSPCGETGDCPGGFCQAPRNVARFEYSTDGLTWTEIDEWGAPELQRDLLTMSFHTGDVITGLLELRVRITRAFCGDDTIAADAVLLSAPAPTPTPTATPGAAPTPTPTASPFCGCNKMTIFTAGKASLDVRPSGCDKDALGPRNTVDLAKPGPYTVEFAFEVKADLVPGSTAALCGEGQLAKRTATTGNGDLGAPALVTQHKRACSEGKTGLLGASCKLDSDCDTHKCKGGVRDGMPCDRADDKKACTLCRGGTSDGRMCFNSTNLCRQLFNGTCGLCRKTDVDVRGKCRDYKFADADLGNDDYAEPNCAATVPRPPCNKLHTAEAIVWTDVPGVEDLRSQDVKTGGEKTQAQFLSFVKGTGGQPSCQCRFNVEWEIDKNGTAVKAPQLHSLVTVEGNCATAQRPVPTATAATPTCTPTPTRTPTPTPTP